MPALTHGRCKNGFNQYARTIKYAQSRCNKNNEENSKDSNGNCYQKALCCGSPIQPQNLRPGHLFQRNRVPTTSCNRKYATNVVTGRSFAAKRAIARRTASSCSVGKKSNNKKTESCCCLLPTLTHSGPRNAYRTPCSGGYIKKTLLNPCINPTTNNKLIK